MKTKYYIDYIYDNPSGQNYYYQLVRASDDAILYANEDLKNIFLFCWRNDISCKDITVL